MTPPIDTLNIRGVTRVLLKIITLFVGLKKKFLVGQGGSGLTISL